MSETDRNLADENPVDSEVLPGNITKFQTACMIVLADGKKFGLEIKEHLEKSYYHEEINHGRLYPNLDSLAEMGLITKDDLDKRTNVYGLTETGVELLEADMGWAAAYMGLDIKGVTDE